MTLAKVLVLGAGLVLSANVAFADDPADPNAGGGAGAGSGSAAGGGVAASSGTAAAGGWGQLNDRPLVLPQGKFEVHGGLPILTLSNTDPITMMTTSETGEALSIGATYGLAAKIEGGIDYAFGVNPNGDVTKGILALHGAYAAMKNDKMELGVAANLNVLTFTTDTDLSLDIGAWFRYKVAPKISIFTGQQPTPTTLSGFGVIALPPVGYQLHLGLGNSQPISLALPVGVGLQATPQVYLSVSTVLANLVFSNGDNAIIFSDYIPIALGGFFSANDKLDLGVTFADDLKNAGDIYVISLAARYYIK